MYTRSIDIVVPTYRLDEQVLLNIVRLPHPPGFNVSVSIVSDNPAVIVPESVQQLNSIGKVQLLINSRNMGAPATRNAGIRAGTGKWILFLDDDIYPENNLLNTYAEAILKNENALGFAGVTRFPQPFNTITKALEIHGTIASFTAPLLQETVIWSPTANVMLNRDKMDKNLFDGSLINAEDIDFLTRNSLLFNERYNSVPNAVVHHPWWNNGGIQTKRMISYGSGASQIARKAPIKRYTYTDFTNSLETILLLLLLYPFAIAFDYGYIIATLLLAVPLAEYITNWLRAIIKGNTYNPLIAFHLLWIKNCYEFGFLYTSLRKGYLSNFARRIEMGFNKPNPSPFRLNRWKIIKLVLISMLGWIILWGRT